jgi:hypothetical protein
MSRSASTAHNPQVEALNLLRAEIRHRELAEVAAANRSMLAIKARYEAKLEAIKEEIARIESGEPATPNFEAKLEPAAYAALHMPAAPAAQPAQPDPYVKLAGTVAGAGQTAVEPYSAGAAVNEPQLVRKVINGKERLVQTIPQNR